MMKDNSSLAITPAPTVRGIGHYDYLEGKKLRAIASNSPAVAARINGTRPTYERAVSHCIVIDLKSGERTITNTTPPEPEKPKKLPPPKPAAHVVPPDPVPWWLSTKGLERMLSREKIPVGEPVPVGDIMRAVCAEAGITIDDIRGHCRAYRFSRPRQTAIYITMTLRPDLSSPQIGLLFGGKDHSTCLNARDVTKRRLAIPNHPMAALYSAAMARLGKS